MMIVDIIKLGNVKYTNRLFSTKFGFLFSKLGFLTAYIYIYIYI